MAVLANSNNKRRGVLDTCQPRLETIMASDSWTSRPSGGVTLVMTVCLSRCVSTHGWGVGVGGSQGWTDVLVDLM